MEGYFGPAASACHHLTTGESIGPQTPTHSAARDLLARSQNPAPIGCFNVCIACQAVFRTQTALVQHGKDFGHRPFRCPCNETFDRPDSLKRHSGNCSQAGGSTAMIDCPLCDARSGSEGFARRDNLLQHCRVRHKLDKKGLAFVKLHLDGDMKTTAHVPPNPAGTAITATHPWTVPAPVFGTGHITDFGYGAPVAAVSSHLDVAAPLPMDFNQMPGLGPQLASVPIIPDPFFGGAGPGPGVNQDPNLMHLTSTAAGFDLPGAVFDVAGANPEHYNPVFRE